MSSITITAIIPAYNAEAYIEECLNSIFNQTRRPDEVIVVDDGSTDNTQDIIKKQFPSVTLIEQKNQGASAARNTGASRANCSWLAFLDADDTWSADKLEKQLAQLDGQKWSHSDSYFLYEGSDTDDQVKSSDLSKKFSGDIFDKLVVGNFLGTSSIIMERETFLSVGGFDLSLKALQDWDFWLRVAVNNPIDYIPEPLTQYRIHQQSTSRSPRKTLPYHLKLIEKIYATNGIAHHKINSKNDTLARSYGVCSIIAEDNKDYTFSLTCLLNSLRYNPYDLWRWKSILRLLIKLAHNTVKGS